MRAFRLRLKGPPTSVLRFKRLLLSRTGISVIEGSVILQICISVPNVYARQKACQPTKVCYRKWTLHGTTTQ
ncbi:hypothetical protein JG687_00005561 [Phytophthora cactorum]|uniref:Uncharacterized protein n=1 Tax=Phytophthora cactorum TaxID=29920 RepID=A0A8T1UNE7_9STRA|nr:hypothetical protein JG687_00005561 [Phytophthora cactorum]